jgi:hypothetical protein
MAADGYHSLIDAMVATRPPPPSVDGDGSEPAQVPPDPATSGAVRSEPDHDRDTVRPAEEGPAPTPTQDEPATHPPFSPAQQSATPEVPPTDDQAQESDPPTIDLTPDTLHLTKEELASMKALAPLIRTPRAAKRLVNTYRLARASLGPKELDEFVGTDDAIATHPAALILLGVLIGFPGDAEDLFQKVIDDRDDDSTWRAFLTRFAATQDDREKLVKALTESTDALSAPELLEPYAYWAARVGRYSFHTSRLVMPRAHASPPRQGHLPT